MLYLMEQYRVDNDKTQGSSASHGGDALYGRRYTRLCMSLCLAAILVAAVLGRMAIIMLLCCCENQSLLYCADVGNVVII